MSTKAWASATSLCLLALALAAPVAQALAPARGPAQRIVVLGPSLCEMAYALGLGHKVVGVSRYCDFPAEAKRKPVVGDALNLNEEALLAAKPDLIVALEGDESRLKRLGELAGAQTAMLPTRRLGDVKANLLHLGDLAGVAPKARRLVAKLDADLALQGASARASLLGRKPTALFVIWAEPLQVAGRQSYLNDLIELAGGQNVVPVGLPGGAYPSFSVESLLVADPEVLLAPATLRAGLSRLVLNHRGLKAAKAQRWRTLPDDLVMRPGPRVAQALGAISAALRP